MLYNERSSTRSTFWCPAFQDLGSTKTQRASPNIPENRYRTYRMELTPLYCKVGTEDTNEMSGEPIAVPVHSQTTKVVVPAGLMPGDTFIYTPENGRSISIVVPDNVRAGTVLNIVIPDEVLVEPDIPNATEDRSNVKFSKATIGAAMVGGLVGAVVLGPIGAVVLGGGAAYASTRKNGKIGSAARKVGDKAFSGIEKAVDWVFKKVDSST